MRAPLPSSLVAASISLITAAAVADEAPPPVVKAKFGKGVSVDTADGDFGLRLGARAQIRASAAVQEDEEEEDSVDAQIRRMRVSIDGHAFGEAVTMKVQLAFAPLDQDPVAPSAVRDAFVTWAPLRDLRLRFGQQKVPFGRQRVVSSGSLQMVDRSIVTGELNLDRDVGLVVFSDDLGGLSEWLGYRVGVFGGDGRNRVIQGSGLLYAGRVELRPSGGGAEISEPDFAHSRIPKLTFALSAAYNHATDRERSTIGDPFATGPWADYRHVGGDVALQVRGFSLTTEVFLRDAVEEANTDLVEDEVLTDVARSGMGGFVQAGQLIGDHFELSARYGTLTPLGDPDNGISHTREIGGAASVYVVEHALKLQGDYFHLDGRGEDDGVHGVRVQLQMIL